MVGSEIESLPDKNDQNGIGKQSSKKSSILGLTMLVIGGILFLTMNFIGFINEIMILISLLLIALGIYMLVSAIFSYFFRKKKGSEKRNYTKEGIASIIILVIGIVALSNSYSSFLGVNIMAIIFGYFGIRKGDRTAAIGGVAGGVLMFISVALFTYFIGFP